MPANPAAAATFSALHSGPAVLVLANAWDPGSARLIEDLGGKAVATSSAAVAWAHGWPDGDALPLSLLAETTRAIAATIGVPLSVDAEGGYAATPEEAAANVAALVEAGAAGINIEDGDGPPELLAAKIRAIRAMAEARGVALFINARADVYLRGLAPAETAVAETLRRAALYAEAGASGLFVPGLADADAIRAVAAGTRLPLNLLARPALPDAAGLAALGVRRLSAGSNLAQMAWATVEDAARDFLATGASAPTCVAGALYGRMNALMARGR